MSLEKYAKATQAKTLQMREWHDFGPAEWIAAAGMTAVNGNPLASVVARWMAGDHKQIFNAMKILIARLERMTGRYTGEDGVQIQDALEWWRDHTCKACKGRGYPVIPDTTTLDESKPCQNCVGSGWLSHFQGREARAYNQTLIWLDAAAGECAGAIRRKVA